MRKNATRLFALLMTLCMLVGIVPMQLIAADIAKSADTSSETTYVFAGSDFQAEGGNSASQTIVSNILAQMQKDYPTMDGFLFAGDYDYDMNYSTQTSDTEGGKKALQQTVQSFYGTDMDEIYVQGNHDNDSTANGTLCSNSGNNDPESGKYGVFVINEKDYMWSDQSSKGSTVKATAESLKTYLDEKIEADFTKPIFVMSHLPLHYSMRTRKDSDGMYANYIFDVLNAAGESGLNIIFMFGHNHSHGWDDYLGGASIFLTKDDSINIAQASQTTFKPEKLNFTYMNAGYTGYYGETGSGVDSTLTMTAFEITDDSVKISRYSADGTHVLKAGGAYGCSYGMQKNNVGDTYTVAYDEAANGYYSADASSLASPCEVMLDKSLSAGNSNGNLGNSDAGTDDTTPTVKEGIEDWVTITEKVNASTKYVAATSIESGEKYVIVGSDYAYAMMKSGSGVKATPVTISGDTLTYNGTGSSNSIEWEFSSASSGTIKSEDSSDRYLYLTIGNSISLSNSATNLTINNERGNKFRIYSSVTSYKPGGWSSTETYYLYLKRTGGWNGSSYNYNFNASTSSQTVRLYKKVETEAQDGLYVIANGELVYDVARGTSAEDALAAVKAGLKVYSNTTNSESGMQEISADDYNDHVTYELDSSYSGTAAGEYAVTVKYDGHLLATAKVVVPKADIESVTVVNREGTVKKGATATADTGAKLRVNYEDGTSEDVPITVAMLSDGNGNNPSTAEITTIAGLSVKYKGKTADGSFTLYVVGKVGNNYPDYPDEGSVNVNKTAKGDQFTSTGVAKVELSASGIPSKKGADVIIMLDLSSSMYNNKVGTKRRVEILEESLENMLAEFKTPLEDGSTPDIRIAVADFNVYYGDTNSNYYLNPLDQLVNGQHRSGSTSASNNIYTGNRTLTASAFVDVNTLANNEFSDITSKTASGTNYDYAFDAVYQLGTAITAKNEEDNVERDLFVLFMSDGAPFQYNYFSSYSEVDSWNNWLTGTVTDDMFSTTTGARNDYYNEEGKHWMAEAIKGDTDKTYPVIRKNDSRDTDGDNWIEVAGLGAKMYSIGFCLADDKDITLKSMDTVIKNIATSNDFYFRADLADELDNAFSQITSDILYAAQNARFVDTMGDAFDLQMSKVTKGASDSVITPITPEITVTSYDIYTAADNVAENLIGTRKGTSMTLEKVTFNDAGTEAYSDQIGDGKTNILVDGVICAKYFYYNTNKTAVTIDGISIPTSKRGGLTSGSTTSLPAETFYWNLGTVKSSELVLSYYVYLTGSVDGTRDAGSYPTNTSATLYYDNYLENPCFKETVSPVMPWGEAHVRYAFYLVDSNGAIVVNETTGQTGSFANRIAVTTPVIAQTFHLNSDGSVDASVLASGVLPDGYTLFDENAQYTVHVSSADNSSWEITKGTEKVATTYVTGFNGNEYSNNLTMSRSGYEYTHTTVWFAVKWTVGALNDTVVIDYGLPVNITVLTNDMFGEKGTLNAVGASAPAGTTYSTTHNTAFDAELTTTYGKATANTNSGTVKYKLNSTNCPQSDTFAYEVKYAGDETQYYYATVTVIPATTVYFEESFVKYTDTKYEGTESENGKWTQDGTAATDSAATQVQDRPGNFSLSNVDANNIYGYDASYNNMTAMSLGGAKKVTVDKLTGTGATAPIASFEFTGTGFDIISLTNSDSGLITVSVYKANDDGTKGSYETGLSVCNYYGYTYSETDGWVATPDTEDCIWQVPVIKIDSLDYGKHYVEIKVYYADAFNLTGDDCYSFWLDAVRIYDPVDATNDKAANDAYTADGEIAPQYMTLRNLLVSAGDLGSKLGTNGAVFIDGKQETDSITDYANPGPNNETYLAYGQGVAFKLHAESKPTAVHIGVKLAKGSASSIRYTVANDKGTTDKQKDITTASDMYYDLGQYITWYEDADGEYTSGTIVLSNATDNDAVLSITNIKYTGMATASAQSLSAIIDNDVITNGVAVMAMYAPVIVPDPFVPEMLEMSWTVGRAGRTSMLTVKTSTDVARLTVNGEELKSVKLPVVTFNRGKLSVSYVRAWVYTVKLELGEHSFDIVAYDENGLASESVKSEVNVTKKNSFFGK